MKLILKIAAGVVLAVVLLVAGCTALLSAGADEVQKAMTTESQWTVDIEAPPGARWSGAFGERSVDGTGPDTVTISDVLFTAAVVQKQSSGSWLLQVRLRDSGGVLLDEANTSAEFGVATVEGS